MFVYQFKIGGELPILSVGSYPLMATSPASRAGISIFTSGDFGRLPAFRRSRVTGHHTDKFTTQTRIYFWRKYRGILAGEDFLNAQDSTSLGI